ncbi:hypothetical protein HMPREF0663_10213 [Hoylesella oralis ATCC 33269]|uniref:Uncharacterized protein n=1 Tax=Hoylesella oralis ATCC 33269 TaxID=873533 RepID=E7RM63_9BACT|nr:hypothetical protein HMPREF0663_10213 [Hoylesella oralis ATCC 33269]
MIFPDKQLYYTARLQIFFVGAGQKKLQCRSRCANRMAVAYQDNI